ncbi:MAG: class I SAM-dependent methyltransferase [Sphingobacteriaceae bacterium]|nr:class I SAM-dependent methyltransferase [Sphingobacteriaceae bacterium]
MSNEKIIQEQYQKRLNTEQLYSSVYANLAGEERFEKTKKLLQQFFSDLSNKTVLEIGAGQGHNVEMLMKCGFARKNISLNELLPERISAIKENYSDLTLYEGDALKIETEAKFDCVFQSTVFTSVLKQEDRVKLAKKMWDLLNPGGIILWYDFIYNNPANKNVRKVSVSNLLKLFPNSKEKKISKVTLAPPIGRRVGEWYPIFNLPFLRTHAIGILKKE